MTSFDEAEMFILRIGTPCLWVTERLTILLGSLVAVFNGMLGSAFTVSVALLYAAASTDSTVE